MRKPICCEWLSNLLQRAGEQGVAVIAVREGETRQFYVQARSLTPWQEKTWDRLLVTEPWRTHLDPLFRTEDGRLVAVVTGMRVPLPYCPSCGANLAKWVKRNTAQFDELEAGHRALADS